MEKEQVLARNVLSTRHIAIVSLAATGPGASIALNFGAMGAFAGPAFVLATVGVLVAILLLGNTLVRLSRRYQSAGSLYAWAVRAFGYRFGFVFGWLFVGSYLLLSAAGFVVIGYWGQTLSSALWGFTVSWWVWSLLSLLVVAALALRGVAQSVQSAFVLFGIEFLVIMTLSIWAIVASPHRWVPEAFQPSSVPAGAGWVGIGLAMTFGILSCVGLEQSATLAEETKDAHRSVARGLFFAAIFIPFIYIVSGYGVVAGLGASTVAKFDASTANPLGDLTTKYWGTGFGTWIVYIAALSSMIAFTQTCFNAATRVLFALSREKLLPGWLGRTHPRFKTPTLAVVVVAGVSVILGFPLAFKVGSLNVWVYYGFMISCMFLIIYGVTNVALFVDTYRNHREDTHWLTTVILPFAGMILMAYPLYRIVFPLAAAPYPLLVGLVSVWIFIGVAVMLWLARFRPAEISRAGLVMAIADELEPERNDNRQA